MNHQRGRAGQFNLNANMQNEVNPRESIGAFRFFHSSSSFTRRDIQRFPADRLSGPNILHYQESTDIVPSNDRSSDGVFPRESIGALGLNISSSSSLTGSVQRFPNRLFGSNFLHYQGSGSMAPSNDRSAVLLPHNIDSAAGRVGNNRYNNQNMSLGFSLHPNGFQTESACSSASLSAINSGVPARHIVDEQGGDGSSANARRLPLKRRSPDHAFREFAIGESSSTDAQASGIPKRRAGPSQLNANNSMNICACPANSHSGHFEAGIGHGNARTVSDVQHLFEAGQTESFQSNINLQTAANPQAFVPPNIMSTRYTRDSHVPLPNQSPIFCEYDQFDHPPFFSPAEIGSSSSVHPFEHVPTFHEALQASWVNITRSRNVPPPLLPIYNVIGSEAMAPFHSPRNIPGNFMLGPQIERENWAHNPANLSISNGNTNFLENFPCPSHQSDSIPGIHLSNAATWTPRLSLHEEYTQISSRIVSHPVAPSIAFTRQSSPDPSDSDPSEISQDVDFSLGLGNSITENEHRSVARSENQAGGSSEPNFTSLPLGSSEMRSRLMDEVRNALEHLRNGGSLRLEELMILDYSLILQMLEARNNQEDEQLNVDNMPYEALVALEDQIGNVDTGLSDEEIMMYLGHEIFHSIAEGTADIETCCICQEDYVNGEELGRLDCGHRFHVACIKQWLLLKNTCPICKQTALAIIDEDEDEEEEDD